jgi:hypothetical protein
MKMSLIDRIEAAIRTWPQWSPAERRRMDDIVTEVMDHVRNGTGNDFVAWFTDNFLADVIRQKKPRRRPNKRRRKS